ncbi:MAG: aspartate dehydrogenase domain-containing protein [Candidatus Omnitrophota bacterium]|jgi:aspartate dehydrogenase
MAKKKIGIVGCGAIGSYLAKRVRSDLSGSARLSAFCDLDNDKALKLSRCFRPTPAVVCFDRLVDLCDIVIEASAPESSFDFAEKALKKKKDIMLMSIAGILDRSGRLFDLARKKKARIILPSGAICGLDALKGAMMGGIKKVSLTTRKPPKGLKGAPFIESNNIDLDSIARETVIFEGPASHAIRAFPKNINVSALLSIAGLGPKKTLVKIITSPEYQVNSHELSIEGDFGKIVCTAENAACAENPKTSFFACLSAFSALKQALDNYVKIGS